MKKIKVQEATDSLASYLPALRDGALVIMANKKPVAALVPIEGVDMESFMMGTNPKFLDLLEHSRRQFECGGSHSLEEVCREFDIDLPVYRKTKANHRKAKTGKRKLVKDR